MYTTRQSDNSELTTSLANVAEKDKPTPPPFEPCLFTPDFLDNFRDGHGLTRDVRVSLIKPVLAMNFTYL